MSETNAAVALCEEVERLYAKAKSGRWEEVWLSLAGERHLAAACSRFAKPSSGWTFLHQAAYAGNELAVRGLTDWVLRSRRNRRRTRPRAISR